MRKQRQKQLLLVKTLLTLLAAHPMQGGSSVMKCLLPPCGRADPQRCHHPVTWQQPPAARAGPSPLGLPGYPRAPCRRTAAAGKELLKAATQHPPPPNPLRLSQTAPVLTKQWCTLRLPVVQHNFAHQCPASGSSRNRVVPRSGEGSAVAAAASWIACTAGHSMHSEQ